MSIPLLPVCEKVLAITPFSGHCQETFNGFFALASTRGFRVAARGGLRGAGGSGESFGEVAGSGGEDAGGEDAGGVGGDAPSPMSGGPCGAARSGILGETG